MSGPDLSVVTGAVDLRSVAVAVVSVAAALVVAYVAKRAARFVLDAVYGDFCWSYEDEMHRLTQTYTREEMRSQGWTDDDYDKYSR